MPKWSRAPNRVWVFVSQIDEGEHAAQPLEHVRAPLLVAVQDHLRIALGGEGVAQREQLLAQRLVVVDLAVVGDDQRAVLVVDRLRAAAQVDDAQAAVPQGRMLVDIAALAVGAAMRDDVRHPLQDGTFHINRHVIDETGDTAHGYGAPSSSVSSISSFMVLPGPRPTPILPVSLANSCAVPVSEATPAAWRRAAVQWGSCMTTPV